MKRSGTRMFATLAGASMLTLALTACGTVTVIGGRYELRERAVEGWSTFEGHTPHRPFVDAVRIACPGCGGAVSRIADVGNPWLDAGIVDDVGRVAIGQRGPRPRPPPE